MFLVQLKTSITYALRQVFGATYPVDDFQNLPITIEFPYQEQQYPGVWVGWGAYRPYLQGRDRSKRGLWATGGHYPGQPPTSSFCTGSRATRCIPSVPLPGIRRDRLHDELVRVFLMSGTPQVVGFRQYIEDNPYINMNMDFDTVSVRGMAENPGTPCDDRHPVARSQAGGVHVLQDAAAILGALGCLEAARVGGENELGHLESARVVPERCALAHLGKRVFDLRSVISGAGALRLTAPRTAASMVAGSRMPSGWGRRRGTRWKSAGGAEVCYRKPGARC